MSNGRQHPSDVRVMAFEGPHSKRRGPNGPLWVWQRMGLWPTVLVRSCGFPAGRAATDSLPQRQLYSTTTLALVTPQKATPRLLHHFKVVLKENIVAQIGATPPSLGCFARPKGAS